MKPFHINRVRKFTRTFDYRAFAVVRAHNKTTHALGRRNAWVLITSSQGSVYRRVQGAGDKGGLATDELEVDYDTSRELGVALPDGARDAYPCEWEIRRVRSPLRLFAAHWHHPDPTYKISVRWSIVSVGLGLIGLVLGILGFAK